MYTFMGVEEKGKQIMQGSLTVEISDVVDK